MSSEVRTWRSRFSVPVLESARPCPGALDLEMIFAAGLGDAEVSIWDPATGATTPLPELPPHVADPVPAADGRSVLVLHDEDGGEVGHLWSYPVGGGRPVDLTPDLPPYTLRGLDVARDGSAVVIAAVTDAGFTLYHLAGGAVSRLFRSRNEAWNSLVTADGTLASIDTTDHNPGVRRFAVTVLDALDGAVLASLSDGPLGPVRGVRFSPVVGDPRLLVSTERTGYARPSVWNPLTGERIDVDAPELAGELVPLDWSDDAARLLLVHVDQGIHRVYEYDIPAGELLRVPHPDGAYFFPEVACAVRNAWASHYGPGGQIRLLRQRADLPLQVLALDRGDGEPRTLLASEPVVPGIPLRSVPVTSKDGTVLQLWVATPREASGPVPLVLNVHGGPNLAEVGGYDPVAQAWLEEGFAYASLNYRGSVTFGREFREGFWGAVGDRELEDIEAAWRWLVDEGVAAPSAVFITGASFGGYLTLLSLGRLPELFAGGFAFIALADWKIAYEDMHPALQAAWRGFIGGTPETAGERFRLSSPMTYIEHVRAPVLINQGRYDTRTPARQAEEYTRRLREAGGDVVLRFFEGGHGPVGNDGVVGKIELELELARKALRGERWSPGQEAR
ncbi:prolyl oligopeptidase family serine peptidase [Streptosporangium sp. NPDC005286]|uniref:prolyl oligopeptidase family serine peptidase n=1 Tax=Streptosporangium sp. NPDC005286 TaxID=3154463 RepID=UPI0033B85374